MVNGMVVTIAKGKVTEVRDPVQETTNQQVTRLVENLTRAVTNLTRKVNMLEKNQEVFAQEWGKVIGHIGNRIDC